MNTKKHIHLTTLVLAFVAGGIAMVSYTALALESSNFRLYGDSPNMAEHVLKESSNFQLNENGLNWYATIVQGDTFVVQPAPEDDGGSTGGTGGSTGGSGGSSGGGGSGGGPGAPPPDNDDDDDGDTDGGDDAGEEGGEDGGDDDEEVPESEEEPEEDVPELEPEPEITPQLDIPTQQPPAITSVPLDETPITELHWFHLTEEVADQAPNYQQTGRYFAAPELQAVAVDPNEIFDNYTAVEICTENKANRVWLLWFILFEFIVISRLFIINRKKCECNYQFTNPGGNVNQFKHPSRKAFHDIEDPVSLE